MEQRFLDFADQLVNYCTAVQPGEVVIIHASDNTPIPMIGAVIQAVNQAGGSVATVWWDNEQINRMLMQQFTEHSERIHALGPLAQASAATVNIVFRGFDNMFELADVPAEQMTLASTGLGLHLRNQRIRHTRWILTRMWTPAMAQLAGMSLERFTDFFFQTVLLDYGKMSRAMNPLQKLMDRTKKVQLIGPGDTDLTFSLDGIGSVKCDGKRNIPDGEVYSAPVRDSANGVVHYNTVTVNKEGRRFEGVRFEVKGGKIVKATCDSGSQQELNRFLDTDEGARYFGEFAIGLNPYIREPIGETLFDEKIDGSFHLTPGTCYVGTPADNGNHSAVHWDIVAIQRPEYGGGKIIFDGKVIRQDGLFVLPELERLNPDRLRSRS